MIFGWVCHSLHFGINEQVKVSHDVLDLLA